MARVSEVPIAPPDVLVEPVDLLLVDDEPDFLEPACRYFRRQGYRVTAAANAEQALATQSKEHFRVAVIDQNMPGMNGLQLLERMIASDDELKVIMLTGGGTIAAAVEAMKLGAVDYLTKPFGLSDLDLLIRRVTHTATLERENKLLKRQLERTQPDTKLIGDSPSMREVNRLIMRIAASDKPALILGESGTGKELIARAIHRNSPLHNKPLVVINCAALPESLLESELFGFEKGAFTGANESKPGLFEVADGGTLFIDEFGELAPALQAKLLRILEDGSMRRIGSVRERRVKVRLIAATNRDLSTEVKAGRFREDLFYRVNVLSIAVPPLRDRSSDIPQLVEHFLGAGWSLESGIMQLFEKYDWPGNVRQLINAIERAKILADDQIIRMENLPADLRQGMNIPSQPASHGHAIEFIGEDVALESLSKMHVLEVLKRNDGNKSKSAKALGIPRRSLYRLLDRFAADKGTPS